MILYVMDRDTMRILRPIWHKLTVRQRQAIQATLDTARTTGMPNYKEAARQIGISDRQYRRILTSIRVLLKPYFGIYCRETKEGAAQSSRVNGRMGSRNSEV